MRPQPKTACEPILACTCGTDQRLFDPGSVSSTTDSKADYLRRRTARLGDWAARWPFRPVGARIWGCGRRRGRGGSACGRAAPANFIVTYSRCPGVLILPSEPDRRTVYCIKKQETPEDRSTILDSVTVIGLAFARAVDAFAAGLGPAMLGAGVLAASAVIGLVASLMTIAGMRLGSFVGVRLGRGAEVLSGLVLIGLGIRILAV